MPAISLFIDPSAMLVRGPLKRVRWVLSYPKNTLPGPGWPLLRFQGSGQEKTDGVVVEVADTGPLRVMLITG